MMPERTPPGTTRPVFARPAQPRPRPAPTAGVVAWTETRRLYTLGFSTLTAAFVAQSLSFWFASAYLFFEYVRPQQIYEWLPSVPYNKICLILTAVCMLVEGRRIRFGIAEAWLAIFSAIVVASSLTATFPQVSIDHLSDYFNWVLIYVLIANTVDTERRFVVFVMMFMIWNFKMSLHGTRSWAADGFAFRDWGTGGAPGFFQNSGEFGIEMCVFIALLAPWINNLRPYWKRWKLLAWLFIALTAVTGIVGSTSRGALLGLGAICLMWMWRSRYKGRALVMTVVIAGFTYFLMPDEAKARFTTMGQDATSVQRTTFWKQGLQMMETHPALGVGFKNWMDYHRIAFPGEYHLLPHNIFIEVGAELGYGALVAFGGLIVATLVINRRTRKLLEHRPEGRFMREMAHGLDTAMLSYLVCGFFVTVFYYPFFWINLAMTMALHNAAVASVAPVASAAPTRPRMRVVARHAS